jgi:alpha-mannosidase
MSERAIWQIGPADLLDTYKAPTALGDVVWEAPAPAAAAPQRWLLFHPSEADPDAGYRLHPYTVRFALDEEPGAAYALRLRYLTIAPRLAHLELAVNGVSGRIYLRPAPSESGEIRLHAGLHTTIYAEGEAEVIVPGALLRRGPNLLVLTARDEGEVLPVTNPEAVRRLDRMASGAGVVYQGLSFVRRTENRKPGVGSWGPDDSSAQHPALARVELRPTVLYRRLPGGALAERCELYLELAGPTAGGRLALELSDEMRSEALALEVPPAALGHLRIPFELFEGPAPAVAYQLRGELGGAPLALSGTLARRRKWTVYVTPHAHTDIGYTHRQWEVAERLCRNIDAALELLEQEPRTENPRRSYLSRPHLSRLLFRISRLRFRVPPPLSRISRSKTYHLDASWALEHYLATRDERRGRRLIEAICAGQIGLASNYVDLLTHFAALEDLIRNGELSETVLRPHGRRAEFAAVVDVASISSAVPDVLAGSGVRYLVHADNQDRGPFRLNGGLHRRSPFYWEGQAGGRVLVWLAKMYCELRKVCGSPPVPDAAARGLDMWLDEYERPDYAPDAVLLYGQEADNTDLDPQPADFVRRWNEAYAYPRLVASDVTSFFADVEARFGERLPVLRGDGGAYWEDGAGSTIAPTMLARGAQAALPAAERLEALAALHTPGWAFPAPHYDEAWRQLLLFDEHTWGAFLSATDPDALLQRDQWATKEQFALAAAEWGRRLLHGAAARHSLSWNTAGREVVIFNPHSWPLAGAAQVEIARGERACDPTTGEPVPMRELRSTATQALVELQLPELPGLSYRRLELRPAPETFPVTVETFPVASDAPNPQAASCKLQSPHYRLSVDLARGCATSLIDLALGRELVDGADAFGLGQLVHAAGGEGTRLVSNQADLPDGEPRLDTSFTLREWELQRDELGERLRLRGMAPHGELEIEWRLPAAERAVELRYTYHKAERLEKEAVYVAFPLALPGATVRSDAQLGWVDWHREQLPGGCKEWLPLQSAIWAADDGMAALIASPDIPLFCVGDMVRGRWPKELELTGGRIFSYVLNNYWHTNYKAAQGGPISFGYRLTSGPCFAPDEAFRFGMAARRPLFAQRISYQDFRKPDAPYTDTAGGRLASLEPGQVHLSTIRPARWAAGWTLRLQEIGGAARTATLRLPGRPIARAWSVDLLEREGAPLPVAPDGSLRLELPAWGLVSVRVELEER